VCCSDTCICKNRQRMVADIDYSLTLSRSLAFGQQWRAS
jgi:hypothetical protein